MLTYGVFEGAIREKRVPPDPGSFGVSSLDAIECLKLF